MKRIALTFDDGPNGRYTTKILDILKTHKIKACFFLLAKNVEYYPAIAKRIKKERHLIGSHGYGHKDLTALKSAEVLLEIEEAEQIYKRILNLCPGFFRPPYGKHNKTVERIVKKKGYSLIDWDVDARDWRGPSSSAIVDRIVSATKDGSIILLHDGANIRHGESRISTMRALPGIIERLKKKGFRFVRLDRLCQDSRR